MPRTVAQSIANLSSGDHACLGFSTDEACREAALQFIGDGLANAEKVFYFADGDGGEIGAWLEGCGLEAASALASGQIEVMPVEGCSMTPEELDPDALVADLRQNVAAAKQSGYPAVRSIGEMTWVLEAGMSVPKILEYEAKVDVVPAEDGVTGLCMFDRRRFTPEIMGGVDCCHPLMTSDSQDDEVLLVEPGPDGRLVVRGEVDRASSESLGVSLAAAALRRDRIRLDLSELGFIDVGGIREIRAATERMRERGGELLLVSPPEIFRTMVSTLGLEGALTLEEAA